MFDLFLCRHQLLLNLLLLLLRVAEEIAEILDSLACLMIGAVLLENADCYIWIVIVCRSLGGRQVLVNIVLLGREFELALDWDRILLLILMMILNLALRLALNLTLRLELRLTLNLGLSLVLRLVLRH